MSDPELLADLGHGKEGHDGKVHPHLVSLTVGEFDVQEAMNRDKLELGIGHDAVPVKGLPRLVQPYSLVRPPKGKI